MSAQSAQKKISKGAKAKKHTDSEIREFLTVQQIMDAPDVTTRDEWIKEWNGYVQIRSITKDEFDEILKAVKTGDDEDGTDNTELQRLLFLASVKQPQFDSESYDNLKEKSAAPYMKILTAVMEHSGLKGLSGKTELEKRFRS